MWSQELFPTQYRSSAQGITIAFTRVVAAVAALFTPLIIEYGPQVLFYFLITTTVVAALIGILWVARIPKVFTGLPTGPQVIASPPDATV